MKWDELKWCPQVRVAYLYLTWHENLLETFHPTLACSWLASVSGWSCVCQNVCLGSCAKVVLIVMLQLCVFPVLWMHLCHPWFLSKLLLPHLFVWLWLPLVCVFWLVFGHFFHYYHCFDFVIIENFFLQTCWS